MRPKKTQEDVITLLDDESGPSSEGSLSSESGSDSDSSSDSGPNSHPSVDSGYVSVEDYKRRSFDWRGMSFG